MRDIQGIFWDEIQILFQTCGKVSGFFRYYEKAIRFGKRGRLIGKIVIVQILLLL